MNPELSPEELRVLGSLIEKKLTTPGAYPLTINALRLACNQSTSREPVVDYDEDAVVAAARSLEAKRLVRLAAGGSGSRSAKYRHIFDEALSLSPAELAVLCVLMLRGPQTPGELKARTDRLHAFGSGGEVIETLGRLGERGLVVHKAREPGQKEARYAHLLGAEDDEESAPSLTPAPATTVEHSLADRVDRLEADVAALRAELRAVRG